MTTWDRPAKTASSANLAVTLLRRVQCKARATRQKRLRYNSYQPNCSSQQSAFPEGSPLANCLLHPSHWPLAILTAGP